MTALRRFYVRPESIEGDRVTVRGPEAHHIAVVLRLRPGDRVVAFDGSSIERVVELDHVAQDMVAGRVVETQEGARLPVALTVLQGIPKGGKMDTVIRIGTELGIAHFVPVQFRRSVGEVGSRLARWRRIAVEAAKQARRPDIPVIFDAMTFASALQLISDCDRIILLWEGERSHSVAEALKTSPTLDRVALIVGPEGGLEPVEVTEAIAAGAVPVSLGPFVLRTEHAAVVAGSMVLYELMVRQGFTSSADPQARS